MTATFTPEEIQTISFALGLYLGNVMKLKADGDIELNDEQRTQLNRHVNDIMKKLGGGYAD